MLIVNKVYNLLQRTQILWAVKLSVSFVIVYYIFTKISFADINQSIRSSNIVLIIFSLTLIICERYVAAYQMKILTFNQGLCLSTNQIFRINFITQFYGLFLPGYLAGGVIKWYRFSKLDKKRTEALTSIVYNRLFETITIIMIGILFFILDLPPGFGFNIILALSIFLVVLLTFYFLVFNTNTLTLLRKISGKSIILSGFFQGRLHKLFMSLQQAQNLSKRNHIVILMLCLVRNMICVFSVLLLAKSLVMDISFINIGWIRSFINIIMMIPISVSGLGVREGSLILLLKTYGITSTDAVALSFLLYIQLLFMGCIGGLLEAYHSLVPNWHVVKKKVTF